MLEGKRRRKERREDKVKDRHRLFRKAGEREQRTGNGADGEQRISQAANNKGLPEKRQSIFKQTSGDMKMLFKGKTDKKQKV